MELWDIEVGPEVCAAPRRQGTGTAHPAAPGRCPGDLLAPGRRVVLLTVFRKTRAQETAEVERAQRLQKECEAAHGHAEDVFDREV